MAVSTLRASLLLQALALVVPALLAAQEPGAAPPPAAGQAAPAPAPEPMPADDTPAPPSEQPAPAPPAMDEAPPPAAPPQQEPVPAGSYEGQVSGNGGGYAEETYPEDGDPEPPSNGGGGFKMPAFSIRLDPFNWLLDGRLGVELEVAPLEWFSVELVPVFVANSEPPTIDFSSLEEDISQHSNGLGSLSGTSLGVGFWLDGKAFSGYVLRAIFTNYGYTFKATDGAGTFDRVNRTERRLMGFFGSYMRWSFFTIGGGIGLGYELNQQERCGLARTAGSPRITADKGADCDGELQLAADRNANSRVDINGFLHPVYLEGRLSLGFIID